MINQQQCGFRKGISTNVAIAKLMSKIISGHNDNKFGIGVFLDLQKAFDTVRHDVLLCKLQHYGIRGVPLQLIRIFLTNRQQYVTIDNCKSQTRCISQGTP